MDDGYNWAEINFSDDEYLSWGEIFFSEPEPLDPSAFDDPFTGLRWSELMKLQDIDFNASLEARGMFTSPEDAFLYASEIPVQTDVFYDDEDDYYYVVIVYSENA